MKFHWENVGATDENECVEKSGRTWIYSDYIKLDPIELNLKVNTNKYNI